MIIYWDTLKGSGGGGGTSIDPGVENVLTGVAYEINNVPLVGTLIPTINNFYAATLNGNLIPASVGYSRGSKVIFTQGDVANINLVAFNGVGEQINLTDATFQTLMNGPGGEVISFPNGKHTANSDQVNNTGQFVLALNSSDTGSVAQGTNKEIITIITIDGSPISYHGFGLLNVLVPEPSS